MPYQANTPTLQMDMSAGSRGQGHCRERPAREVAGAEPETGRADHLAPQPASGGEPGCSDKLRGAAGQVPAGKGHDEISAARKGCSVGKAGGGLQK